VFLTSHYGYRSEITKGVTRCACVWDDDDDDDDECAQGNFERLSVQLELQEDVSFRSMQ
jgi:hypothetical protein